MELRHGHAVGTTLARLSGKQAIDDPQGPVASLREIVVVGHDNERCLPLSRQTKEQVHDGVAGFGIEIASGFVGENDVGIVR